MFTVPDRALMHLEAVVRSRLREHHAFPIMWSMTSAAGGGHGSAWISPGVDVRFTYAGSDHGELNANWLRLLRAAADSGGLRLLPEPPRPAENES